AAGHGTEPADPSAAPGPALVAPQPEPEAATSRPRRARRAASRPAGPPADGEPSEPVTVGSGPQDSAGGDPV
ncbi:hypothetical protein, partial [Pseudonocardia ailaonensis]